MTDEEKALREKLGITDPLQLRPAEPDEKAQQIFKSKISDDILSASLPPLTKEQAQIIRDRKKIAIEDQNSSFNFNMLPPIDEHLPEIKYHQKPTKVVRQDIKIIASSDSKKVSFSERFKDAQKRIESETNNSVSVSSTPVKLK